MLSKALKKIFPNSEFFVPAAISYVGGDRVVTKLIDNYAFVRSGLPDQVYKKAENTRYVLSVLMKPDRKRFEVVSDHDIERMKGQLEKLTNQDIEIGDEVEILSGPYRQMKVKVFEEIPETGMVSVMVELRSKSQILTLPRDFLKVVRKTTEEEKVGTSLTPYVNRIAKTRTWLSRARSFLELSVPLSDRRLQVQKSWGVWSEVVCFQEHVKQAQDLLHDLKDPSILTQLDVLLKEYIRYLNRAPDFFYLQESGPTVSRLLQATHLKEHLSLIKGWLRKLQRIDGKVRELDNALSNRE